MVLLFLLLLAATLEVGESSNENRVMFERSRAVRFAITASVSCKVSPGKSSTAASVTWVSTVDTAGASVDSSTSVLFVIRQLPVLFFPEAIKRYSNSMRGETHQQLHHLQSR